MKSLIRIAIAGAIVSLFMMLGAEQASANTTELVASHNGAETAKATYDDVSNQLCVNLHTGYSSLATLNGNKASDYIPDGNPVCVSVTDVVDGDAYTMRIHWWGVGGAYVLNFTSVTA